MFFFLLVFISNEFNMSFSYLTEDAARRFGVLGIKYLDLGVVPCLCIVGLFTNALCIITVRNLGVSRNFNLILLLISISAVFYMFNLMNVVGLICYYSMPEAEMASDNICPILDTVTKANSMYIFCFLQRYISGTAYFFLYIFPSIATMERVVAVYFPLKLKLIVTRQGIVNTCIFFAAMVSAFEFAFIFNEYEIGKAANNNTNIEIVFNSTKFEVPSIIPREGRNEELIYFERHLWIWVCPAAIGIVTIIGSILVCYKVPCNRNQSNQLSRSQASIKNRNKKLFKSIMSFNSSYVFLDLSCIVRAINNSALEERNPYLTSASHILAVVYCNTPIFVHLFINADFRARLANSFSSLNKIRPLNP